VEERRCEPERDHGCSPLFFFSGFVSPAATALSLLSRGLLAPFFERECASLSSTKNSHFSS
jgi:hypothetical protein